MSSQINSRFLECAAVCVNKPSAPTAGAPELSLVLA